MVYLHRRRGVKTQFHAAPPVALGAGRKLLAGYLFPRSNSRRGIVVRRHCPHCFQLVSKGASAKGLQYCTNCRTLFLAVPQPSVPLWVFGVLAILTVNWQILFQR